jgi:hypothetical protein
MWRPVYSYIFVVGRARLVVLIPVSCEAGRVNTDTVIVVSRRGSRRPSQRFVCTIDVFHDVVLMASSGAQRELAELAGHTHTAYNTSTYYFWLLAILKI